MIIQKSRLFLSGIEALVDCWGLSLVGDLENAWQTTDERAGQIFEVIQEIWLLKVSKERNY